MKIGNVTNYFENYTIIPNYASKYKCINIHKKGPGLIFQSGTLS